MSPEPVVVIAPDKFKGSLTAARVASALAEGLRGARPDIHTLCIPIADGGDGTAAAALAAGWEWVPVTVAGARPGTLRRSGYARRGPRALVELAGACGLAGEPRPLAPLDTTTIGPGRLVRHALDAGCRDIVLGLGGSASTDGGLGLLSALGAVPRDADGRALPPTGRHLSEVAALDLTELDPRVRGATPTSVPATAARRVGRAPEPEARPGGTAASRVGRTPEPGTRPVTFTLATDVTNPLTGPDGAARVFGPQKGADPGQVAHLDAGLANLAQVLAATTGTDPSALPGGGAAGGVGAGAAAVLGARIVSGAALVFELTGLDAALRTATLVITGEGCLDRQTLSGKGPAEVARRAAAHGVPAWAVAGTVQADAAALTRAGFDRHYALTDLEPDLDTCVRNAAPLLRRVGRRIAATIPTR